MMESFMFSPEGEPLGASESVTAWIERGEVGRSGKPDGRYWIGSDEVCEHHVSTVWIGVNHNFSPDGPPLIFETMVFCRHDEPPCELDRMMWRYSTKEEATLGHAAAIQIVELEKLVQMP